MSEPFLAEVKIVGFSFAPRGYAFCDGQILPINQNQSLFSLLGTIYGGDGRTTFALPDLRGRTPVREGTGTSGHTVSLGQKLGEETHALTTQEIPNHDHVASGAAAGETQNAASPAGALLATTAGGRRPLIPYGPAGSLVTLAGSSVGQAGNNQGHENMQPYLALNFCIALQGTFPSRN
jgi:microcystin-dependent protein